MIWSYTLFRDFENCPHKAFRLHVKKDLPRQPPSPEMKYGNEAHAAFETRLKGGELPANFAKYERFAVTILATGLLAGVEEKLGVDQHGEAVGFFDTAKVVGRGKADTTLISDDGKKGLLVDWKTGKMREDPLELEVLSFLASRKWPQVVKWKGMYVWLKENTMGQMHKLDPEAAGGDIIKRLGVIAQDRRNGYPKRPNPLCGWCPVADCEHNKVKS